MHSWKCSINKFKLSFPKTSHKHEVWKQLGTQKEIVLNSVTMHYWRYPLILVKNKDSFNIFLLLFVM